MRKLFPKNNDKTRYLRYTNSLGAINFDSLEQSSR